VSTKETRWNIPPELEDLKKKIQTEEKPRYNWSLDEFRLVFNNNFKYSASLQPLALPQQRLQPSLKDLLQQLNRLRIKPNLRLIKQWLQPWLL
jgi:hypothetical protein